MAYRDRPIQRPPAHGVVSGGAWPLGRISDIQIAVDYSWVLIFALITASLAGQFADDNASWSSLQSWVVAIATSLLFFGSIVLHELGHSLTAQRLGLRVRSITLFVFGGMAELDSDPDKPGHEVVIAVAGPIVSLALAAAFGWAARQFGEAEDSMMGATCAWLARINLALGLFNVVPGFPLDGGRVLRGIVWAITGSFTRATRVAATSGSLFAYALMALGVLGAVGGQLVSGLWLVFIGWFLLSAAKASVGQLAVERILSRLRSIDVAEPTTGACISGTESVADLIAGPVLVSGIRTFYVVDASGHLEGLVTLRELAGVRDADRPRTRAGRVMVPAEQLATLHPDETAWSALRRMAEHRVNQLPVVASRRLIGAVTRERLLDLVQVGLALESGERFEAA